MRVNKLLKRAVGALGAIAMLPALATAQDIPEPDAVPTVIIQPRGEFIGQPEAEHTLTEFVSYTCPHCAHFAQEGDAALKLAYLPTGKVRVEVRAFVRDPIDLAAALLVRCGDGQKFERNHRIFMTRQSEWLPRAKTASAEQKHRWSTGPIPTRMRAIAADFGFYEMMEAEGYGRPELDRCLGDEAMTKRMMQSTQAAFEGLRVQGTPSFAFDGKLLAGVHNWAMLKPILDKRLGFGE